MPLFPKQRQYYEDLLTGKYTEMLYGGAVHGGKTFLVLAIFHQFATRFPGTRYAVFRKKLVFTKRTTIPSFRKLIKFENESNPQYPHSELFISRNGDIVNKSDSTVYYKNGSEIVFMGCDPSDDPNFTAIGGLELTCAAIEEAGEISYSAYEIIKTRIGRHYNDKYNIPNFLLMTCNPDKAWLKELFYDPWIEKKDMGKKYYLPALPTDNPYSTPEYLETLKNLSPSQKSRLYYGNWDYSDDPDQLIYYEWLKDCFHEHEFNTLVSLRENRFKVSLGVDVAGSGSDDTIFCYFVGNKLAKFKKYNISDPLKIAEIICREIKIHNINQFNVAVDSIGEGSAVTYKCSELGYPNVVRYKGSFSSKNREDKKKSKIKRIRDTQDKFEILFWNLRAESHWLLREDIRRGNIYVLNDKDFIKESTNVRWLTKDEVIIIEPKEETKKRINKSPDYLDAAVIANWVRKNNKQSYKVNIDKIPDSFSSPFKKIY